MTRRTYTNCQHTNCPLQFRHNTVCTALNLTLFTKVRQGRNYYNDWRHTLTTTRLQRLNEEHDVTTTVSLTTPERLPWTCTHLLLGFDKTETTTTKTHADYYNSTRLQRLKWRTRSDHYSFTTPERLPWTCTHLLLGFDRTEIIAVKTHAVK